MKTILTDDMKAKVARYVLGTRVKLPRGYFHIAVGKTTEAGMVPITLGVISKSQKRMLVKLDPILVVPGGSVTVVQIERMFKVECKL